MKARRQKIVVCAVACLLACALALSACASGNATIGNAAAGNAMPDADSKDEYGTGIAVTNQDADESLFSYDDIGFAMGTVVNQTLYTQDKSMATGVTDLLNEIESLISWRVDGSDIARINAGAGSGAGAGASASAGAGAPVMISDESEGYLRKAVQIADDTEGAFDPTIGLISRLWNFDDGKNEVPDGAEIKALLKDVGYSGIQLESAAARLVSASAIDLGAIGKGIGCDEVEAFLDGKGGVRGALINIGGSSVLAYGMKDSQEPWKVAVLDPRDEEAFLGVLSVSGTCNVSTSADYERYFEKDGKRYHHLLDPATGYPADSGLMSVTIVARRGAVCDALSTACFVRGYEDSVDILRKYEAEAIFVYTDKRVRVTNGLKGKFSLIAEGYNLL